MRRRDPSVAAGERISAVGYCRKSTDRQEASVPEQRAEILKLAAREGYHVSAWYVDEGEHGDADNRPEFLRMLRDVMSPQCPFRAILCFDQGRFSRHDQDTATVYFVLLRDQGVILHSCVEGIVIDPEDDDLGASLKRNVNQYAKNKYLKDLAFAIARSKMNLANRGVFGGDPPYGTVRLSKEDHRLGPGSESQRRVIGQIFIWFLAGWSKTAIAHRLNLNGVPSPNAARGRTGKNGPCKWSARSILCILRNPVYVGTRRFGRTKVGRHVMIEGDRLLAVPRAQQGSRTTNWEGGFTPQVAPYVGKPIIAYATWKRAQDMLDSTADHVCRRNLRSLPLIGIAKCGICGSPLISHRVRHSGREWMYYRCSSNVGGSRVAGRSTHKDFGIPAEKLWRAVVRKVLDDYLSDEAIASLMHTIETQRRQLAETGRSSLEDLKASITDLEKRRATIKANMVYAAGRDAVIAFSDELTSVAKQLEAAKGELMAAKNLAGESRKGLKDTLASVRKFYVSLRDRIQSTRSAETEDAIRIVVKQVIVGVQQKPPVKKGSKRQRVTIANVEIVVDAQLPDVSPMSLFNRNHKSQWFRLNKLRLVVSGDEFSRA